MVGCPKGTIKVWNGKRLRSLVVDDPGGKPVKWGCVNSSALVEISLHMRGGKLDPGLMEHDDELHQKGKVGICLVFWFRSAKMLPWLSEIRLSRVRSRAFPPMSRRKCVRIRVPHISRVEIRRVGSPSLWAHTWSASGTWQWNHHVSSVYGFPLWTSHPPL